MSNHSLSARNNQTLKVYQTFRVFYFYLHSLVHFSGGMLDSFWMYCPLIPAQSAIIRTLSAIALHREHWFAVLAPQGESIFLCDLVDRVNIDVTIWVSEQPPNAGKRSSRPDIIPIYFCADEPKILGIVGLDCPSRFHRVIKIDIKNYLANNL